MAYAVTNPPARISGTLTGKSLWFYASADDDATTNGASYYSNGVSLGMKIGDAVLVADSTTPKVSLHGVNSISGDAVTTGFAAVA